MGDFQWVAGLIEECRLLANGVEEIVDPHLAIVMDRYPLVLRVDHGGHEVPLAHRLLEFFRGAIRHLTDESRRVAVLIGQFCEDRLAIDARLRG